MVFTTTRNVEFNLDGKSQSCLLPAQSFNRFDSHQAFQRCTSKETEPLVMELQNALKELDKLTCSSSDATDDSTSVTDDSTMGSSDLLITRETMQEERADSSSSKPGKRKGPSTGSTSTSTHKKFASNDEMQESCEKCLVSTTSQFIPIDKLGLPVRPSRQFRRVNNAFVESLTQELLKEPFGSYGCLFVVAKGIDKKETFDPAKKDAYDYEVLGGTHLMLATKQLHAQDPENKYFSGRMARIYCGLSDDQAIYLGAMHQKSSSFCHDVTYREEVERCRLQLYGGQELDNDTPKPSSLWRDTCSRILYKDKRNLSEVFSMAQVSCATWDAFVEVNNLYESGKLKAQKFSSGDVAKGTLALKQWHIKPLVSLPDESKLYLLKKISSGEILLKDLKKEADAMKTCNTVQSSVMTFFKIKSWDEAVLRFGALVDNEKLLRFTGNFEDSHDFQMFLKRLKRRESAEETEGGSRGVEEFTSSDGVTKGHAIFSSNLEEVTQSMEYFKSNFVGISLAIGVVGFDDKDQLDVVQNCTQIVKLLSRLNFTLLSSFNCAIMCPVSFAHDVAEIFTKEGASLTQQGFVHHKQELNNKQGIKMQEVVSTYIVGHWAASRLVGNSHVNYTTPPSNIVDVNEAKIGEEYPISFYHMLVSWFSKDGSTVLEVGCGNEVGNAFLASLNSGRQAILLSTSCDQHVVCQKMAKKMQKIKEVSKNN